MNILWVSELFPPAIGGVANSADRIVNNLRKSGINVDVVGISNDSKNSRKNLAPPFNEVEGGLELILKPQIKMPYTLQIVFHNLRRLHRLRNYALVHGFFAVYAGYNAAFAAKTFKIPSVVSFRGNDFDKVLFDYAKKPFLNDTMNWATAITYLSDEMHENLKIVKPDGDYYYIPNSINTEKYSCGEAEILKASEMKKKYCPSGERLLGLVGELKFKKGLHFILKILPEIRKIEKTKLLVVGAVNQIDLKILLENPDVIYQPYLSASEIVSMYTALDFLLLPSIFEGMPNVMLESMYLGAINIASDIAAMRDVIEDNFNGFKFFPHDKEDFLRVIKRAYSLSTEELSIFKKRSKEKAMEYTMERETSGYLNLYNKLLVKHKNQ